MEKPFVLISLLLVMVVVSDCAHASYTATGQYCQLPPATKQNSSLATCSAEFDGKSTDINLLGSRPNKVREIQFILSGSGKLVQTLKLSATPLIDPETVAIMIADFNFDGRQDFAIMPRVSKSENVKYLYYLYDEPAGKLQPSAEMALIYNPEIFPSERHIRSYWRKSPTLSGWNFWRWEQGKPFIARRIEQSTINGHCQQTTTRFENNKAIRSAPDECL